MVKPGDRLGILTVLEPVWVQLKRQRETQWRIRCDCGREYTARIHNLRRQKSCGCLNRSKWSRQLRERFRNHVHRARSKHGGVWEFTQEEAFSLFLSRCVYCGVEGTEQKPLGIDRIDSEVGYTKQNSQPCCDTCNKMKLDMTHSEFVEHVARIHECQLSR